VDNQTQAFRNVMEALVVQEVEHQLDSLPLRKARYINVSDVVAYALNRLPPLYATSEEGRRTQERRAKLEYAKQIAVAVRQGMVAVERDPLRSSTPLKPVTDAEALDVLEELKELFHDPNLSWGNLVETLKQTLGHTQNGAARNGAAEQWAEDDDTNAEQIWQQSAVQSTPSWRQRW
jgi:hypothetical protein